MMLVKPIRNAEDAAECLELAKQMMRLGDDRTEWDELNLIVAKDLFATYDETPVFALVELDCSPDGPPQLAGIHFGIQEETDDE